jgi:hypothetical protein
MTLQAMARVMGESEAAGTARLVLLVMANRAGGDQDVCFASVERIAHECRISERAVQENIRRLRDSGDLVFDQVHPDYRTNVYFVMPVASRSKVQNLHPPATERQQSAPKQKKQEVDLELQKTSSTPESAPFDLFWEAYPRRVGKGQARKAWNAALKIADPQTLIDAADSYADAVKGSETQFIAHPATWLNGERWTDEEVAAPEPVIPEYVPQPPASDADLAAFAEGIRQARQRMTEGQAG